MTVGQPKVYIKFTNFVCINPIPDGEMYFGERGRRGHTLFLSSPLYLRQLFKLLFLQK